MHEPLQQQASHRKITQKNYYYYFPISFIIIILLIFTCKFHVNLDNFFFVFFLYKRTSVPSSMYRQQHIKKQFFHAFQSYDSRVLLAWIWLWFAEVNKTTSVKRLYKKDREETNKMIITKNLYVLEDLLVSCCNSKCVWNSIFDDDYYSIWMSSSSLEA